MAEYWFVALGVTIICWLGRLVYQALNSESESEANTKRGCVLMLIAAMAALLAIVFWSYSLPIIFLLSAVWIFSRIISRKKRALLQSIARINDRRHSRSICTLNGVYGRIISIELSPSDKLLLYDIHCELFSWSGTRFYATHACVNIDAKWGMESVDSTNWFILALQKRGLIVIEELSVEARAVAAAFNCLKEYTWADGAIGEATSLLGDLESTLRTARCNKLLSGSIPEMEIALVRIQREKQKLVDARSRSENYLRQIYEFLSVPSSVRAILDFDVQDFFDPASFADLERSFDELIELNNVYRDLARNAIS